VPVIDSDLALNLDNQRTLSLMFEDGQLKLTSGPKSPDVRVLANRRDCFFAHGALPMLAMQIMFGISVKKTKLKDASLHLNERMPMGGLSAGLVLRELRNAPNDAARNKILEVVRYMGSAPSDWKAAMTRSLWWRRARHHFE
jgi:hypothetical protein